MERKCESVVGKRNEERDGDEEKITDVHRGIMEHNWGEGRVCVCVCV